MLRPALSPNRDEFLVAWVADWEVGFTTFGGVGVSGFFVLALGFGGGEDDGCVCGGVGGGFAFAVLEGGGVHVCFMW